MYNELNKDFTRLVVASNTELGPVCLCWSDVFLLKGWWKNSPVGLKLKSQDSSLKIHPAALQPKSLCMIYIRAVSCKSGRSCLSPGLCFPPPLKMDGVTPGALTQLHRGDTLRILMLAGVPHTHVGGAMWSVCVCVCSTLSAFHAD